MFDEDYEKLLDGEKEEFKRVCNYLLSKTFVLDQVYDRQSKRMIHTPEFRFIEKYSDIFTTYLNIAGFQLEKDTQNNIYRVSNVYGYNIARFDQFTTYLLLALMVIYEEQAPIANLGNSVVCNVQDVNKEMQLLNMFVKKPTKEATRMAYRRLEQFNLVIRLNTTQDVEDWKIMILPTITSIVSYDKIKELCDDKIPEILKDKFQDEKQSYVDENSVDEVGGDNE